MKQYEVLVRSERHGHYYERFFTMIVASDSCIQAEQFAEELVREMTYEEFFSSMTKPYDELGKEMFLKRTRTIKNDDGSYSYEFYNKDVKDHIGDDCTIKFKFKARVFKG